MADNIIDALMKRIRKYEDITDKMEIEIADDGEILLKGENIFHGYWKMEEETKESFTADGYLKSGDIGMFDEDGFLLITDRKKDLIITSGGKNVAPQKIENIFKIKASTRQINICT